MKGFFIKVIRNRVFLHSLFWLISFYILLQHFSISSAITHVDYIFTFLFHAGLVISVYLNLYFLIPRYLNRQQYLIYLSGLLVLFVFYYLIHVFTFDILSEILFEGYYLITFYSFTELFKYFIIYVGLTTLFFLSSQWFELIESRKKLAETEKENVQNELKALKAQINPHFLFNSLNTIYSLALKNAKNTAEVVLKLSDVLRYMIYESNEKYVALEKEITFIRNYIELQKLRTHVSEVVSFEINGQTKDQLIAPLIFIVFIENAFKHGLKGDIRNQFIHIHLNIFQNKIEFLSENNIGIAGIGDNDPYKGLGLENVQRRLELMYPGKHDLGFDKINGTFSVSLTIMI